MAAVRDLAVCLRQFDWSETSQIVTVFTRDHGLIRGLAKGARRPRSAFDGGLEPLTAGELLFIPRRDRELLTLTGWSLTRHHPGLSRRFDAYAAAAFVADVTQTLMPPLDPHPALHDRLSRQLGAIDAATAPPALLALAYALDAVRTAGLAPTLPDAGGFEGGLFAFHPDEGVFEPVPPNAGKPSADRWLIRRGTLDQLRAVDEASPDPGSLNPAVASSCRRAIAFLCTLIEYRTGRAPRSGRLLLQTIKPTDTA